MDKDQPIEKLRNAAQTESNLTKSEFEISDAELLAKSPFPAALEEPYDPVTPPARLLRESTAPPVEVPRVYAPVRIIKHVEKKTNTYGKEQASVQAVLEPEGKPAVRLLVSSFGEMASFVESLEVGAVYALSGVIRSKVVEINGDKVVSFYLNLM
ncbi:MAG: hypothetical protein ABSC05_38625 [Candidatus Solibacter sp.]